MRAQSPIRHQRRGRHRAKIPALQEPTGFLGAWTDMLGPEWTPMLPRRRGRKARVPVKQLLQTLTFHVMQGAGTLAEHFFELFDEPLANSS